MTFARELCEFYRSSSRWVEYGGTGMGGATVGWLVQGGKVNKST